jgi:diguanylate cyclase (GGDEF)-like protein
VLLAASATFGAYSPYMYSSYFLVVFVWIGVSHPRGTALVFVPAAALAYLVPVAFADGSPAAMWASVEVLAMIIAVGEGLAWISTKLSALESKDAHRLVAMHELVHAGEMLARETDAMHAPSLVAELGSQLLRARSALVLVTDGDGSFTVAGAARWTLAQDASQTDAPGLLRALRSAAPSILEAGDVPFEPSFPDPAYVAFPLRGVTSPLGLLLLARERDLPVDTFAEQLGITFASQAGLALERVQATQELIAASLRDELTGLGNRRYGDRVLSRVRPNDVIVMIDLDGFKALNDEHGHVAGDEALRRIGGLLQRCLRDQDHAIRWGGDEFCLVLRGGPALAPERVIERLRTAWSHSDLPVGFSAGLAVHDGSRRVEETVAIADGALYRAKSGGRSVTIDATVAALVPSV